MIKAIIISLVFTFAFAAKCPDIAVKQGFDVNQYLGKWYEIERFPFVQEDNLKCITAEYTLNADNSVKVNNTGININDNKFTAAIGRATIPNPNEPSKLAVKFSPLMPISANYWIIDTDYETSLVYSCTSILNIFTLEYAWILSRNPTVRAERIGELKNLLSSKGIDVSKFLVADQKNCN